MIYSTYEIYYSWDNGKQFWVLFKEDDPIISGVVKDFKSLTPSKWAKKEHLKQQVHSYEDLIEYFNIALYMHQNNVIKRKHNGNRVIIETIKR